MKKFKFRYESVLKMRMNEEDRIKNELAKKIKERQNILDALENLSNDELEYLKHIDSVLRSGKANKEMHSFSEGKKYYKTLRDQYKLKLSKVEADIEGIKQLLVEAMKSRKVMDKLKEKAFQTYIDEYNEMDAKLIEEVVNYKNNKSNGE
ncbi:MAG: flagellar export protein FliJ [Clostridia bacterium]|nr:flagellar export protein FliJ [Clostridia bacterium]